MFFASFTHNQVYFVESKGFAINNYLWIIVYQTQASITLFCFQCKEHHEQQQDDEDADEGGDAHHDHIQITLKTKEHYLDSYKDWHFSGGGIKKLEGRNT